MTCLSRTLRRLLLVSSLVIGLALAESTAAQGEPSAVQPGAADVPTIYDYTMEDFVKMFAQSEELSLRDAEAVFSDSPHIKAFIEGFKEERGFGSLWASYDVGYQIHVRLTDHSLDDAVQSLGSDVIGPVSVHYGGSSARELDMALKQVEAAAVPFEVDVKSGRVTVYRDSLSRAQGTLGLVEVAGVAVIEGAPPRPQVQLDGAHAGADVWQIPGAGTPYLVCTAAAMWKGPAGTTGYLTAGHCPVPTISNYTYVDGGYSHPNYSVFSRSCGIGGDYALIRFYDNTALSNTFLDKRYDPPVATNFHIAGGYYVGQPTFKVGLSTNGTTGTNMGSVQGYGAYDLSGAPLCPGNPRKALKYWNSRASGDSGGPVFLFYGTDWYLGAVHNGRTSIGDVYGTAIWDIARGTAQYCSLDFTC